MRAGGSKRTPAEVVSRILREQTFYTIPAAGRQIGLTRTPAYLAAAEGVIPTEKYGKRLLVRRAIWDEKVKRLYAAARGSKRRAAPKAAAKVAEIRRRLTHSPEGARSLFSTCPERAASLAGRHSGEERRP